MATHDSGSSDISADRPASSSGQDSKVKDKAGYPIPDCDDNFNRSNTKVGGYASSEGSDTTSTSIGDSDVSSLNLQTYMDPTAAVVLNLPKDGEDFTCSFTNPNFRMVDPYRVSDVTCLTDIQDPQPMLCPLRIPESLPPKDTSLDSTRPSDRTCLDVGHDHLRERSDLGYFEFEMCDIASKDKNAWYEQPINQIRRFNMREILSFFVIVLFLSGMLFYWLLKNPESPVVYLTSGALVFVFIVAFVKSFFHFRSSCRKY